MTEPAYLRVPDPADLSPETTALLARFPTARGARLELFLALTDAPRVMQRIFQGGMLDPDSPLTLRERELVIWRVCARCGCEYEWGVHVAGFARAAGLEGAQVEATLTAPSALGGLALDDDDRLLLEVVDALHDQGDLPDALRERFARRHPREVQLEIIALAGFYHSISWIANVARLPCEPFGPGFRDTLAALRAA